MSRRRTSMFTIQICGGERLCVQTANGQRFANYATAVSGTHCDYITKKAGFSVGGIIGCFHFRKIADYVSTQFWRVKRSRRNARQRGSIGKCVKGKNLRIMPRSGRSLNRWFERSTFATRHQRMKTHLRVSNPLSKPLMIWDGECHFCRRWIERWREITAGEVDYATYQEAADRFPEIPLEQFQRAVAFIEPDGKAFFAAEAVYRSLACRSSRKWMTWGYDHVPSFAAISEIAYGIIARHRKFGSAFTRVLWGRDVRPPTYFWARRWFLRAVGLVYLIAFVSLWIQVAGLIGANGISPLNQFLPAVREQLGRQAYSLLPTLCWFDSSNTFLHFLCGAGVAFSLLLVFGIAPVICLTALFVFYLSLTISGQTFLSFQWDILLLEIGFLSIFLAPWQLWWTKANEPPVSRAAIFL